MTNNRLDIIIFGATGYTGKFVVQKAANLCKEEKLKFGIAGRRKEALEVVLKEFAPEIENVSVILADVRDEESIKKMTEQAKVLINCCGPYRFYGESIIKACIATGTHYTDVSGEPQFMEGMQLKYDKAAQEAGIYIISACGFDSIPTDLGIIFTQQKFDGEVNSIEVYNEFIMNNVQGSILNYGTWESLIYSIAHKNELRELRTKLYPNKLPELRPKLKNKCILHRNDVSQEQTWSTLFLSSDRSVAQRTQRFLYEKYKERPAQIQTYITFRSLLSFISMTFIGIILFVLSHIAYGRNLLLKYPSLFSGGRINHQGPDPKILNQTSFSITFKALGWSEKLTDFTNKHTDPPNKMVITKVSGDSPAYGFTSTAVLLTAIIILKEADKMPNNGGVLSPGAAFGKTCLIEKLNKHGFKFEMILSKI